MTDSAAPHGESVPAGVMSLSGVEHVIAREPSLCAVCEQPADALVLERDDRVYHRTLCAAHAGHETLVFSDSRLYRKLLEWNDRIFPPEGLSGLEAIEDEDDQKTPLLAILDLTNRCNFNCPVCFAEAGTQSVYYLPLDTVRRMLAGLVERQPLPCRHIQFSGGEPTLHPQFIEIVRMAREMGFVHIQVATNGSMFAQVDFTRRCEEAGLHTLYLQFDAMDDDVYVTLRGQKLLDRKLRILENVAATSMRVVLVPTIVAGVNVHQLGPIFRFAVEHSHHITGISVQPMASTGRVKLAGSVDTFNLADLAAEFSRQTGLTRYPDDWFPLNALSLLTRGLSRVRQTASVNPSCDAQCSIGTYFHVDDRNQATCLTSFFDLERFLRSMTDRSAVRPSGVLRKRISGLSQLHLLSSCFDSERAPRGLTFLRLLRGLDGWEDKKVGRSRWWFRRGFNGVFVAGMHFMDATNYSVRRVRRCIIKYVTLDGRVVSFCNYNAGEHHRVHEDAARLQEPIPGRP